MVDAKLTVLLASSCPTVSLSLPHYGETYTLTVRAIPAPRSSVSAQQCRLGPHCAPHAALYEFTASEPGPLRPHYPRVTFYKLAVLSTYITRPDHRRPNERIPRSNYVLTTTPSLALTSLPSATHLLGKCPRSFGVSCHLLHWPRHVLWELPMPLFSIPPVKYSSDKVKH